MDLNTFGIEDVSDEDVALRFTISSAALKRMLDKTSVVVSGKDFVPILMNFCVQASPSAVRILTSSLDLAMLASSKDVTVPVPGKAFFPVKRLSEIVASAPDGDLSIEARGSATTGMTGRVAATSATTGARTIWALALHSGIGYPALPALGDLRMQQIPRAGFCQALKAVSYAAAGQGGSGVVALSMVSFQNGWATAYDGARLARTRFVCEALPEHLQLPIGAVDDVLRLLDKNESAETFLLGQTDTHIVLHYDNDVLVVAQSAQVFPDVEPFAALPKGLVQAKLPAQTLADALKQVRVSIDLESPLVAISISSNAVVVHTKDKYGNKTLAELPTKVLIPNDTTLLFSYRYLLQLIQKFPDPDFIMSFDAKPKSKHAVFFVSKDETSIAVLPQAVAF